MGKVKVAIEGTPRRKQSRGKWKPDCVRDNVSVRQSIDKCNLIRRQRNNNKVAKRNISRSFGVTFSKVLSTNVCQCIKLHRKLQYIRRKNNKRIKE